MFLQPQVDEVLGVLRHPSAFWQVEIVDDVLVFYGLKNLLPPIAGKGVLSNQENVSDSAHAPDVRLWSVVLVVSENFRRLQKHVNIIDIVHPAIVLIEHGLLFFKFLNNRCLVEAGKLDMDRSLMAPSMFFNKNMVQADVAVLNSILVQVLDDIQQLHHDGLDIGFWQTASCPLPTFLQMFL